MGARSKRHHVRAGYFNIYDCTDNLCNDCSKIETQPIHFGVCMPAMEAPTDCMEYYQMVNCYKGHVSVSTWGNAQCHGKPEITNENCFLTDYDGSDLGKDCVVVQDGDDPDNREYYKYDCEFAPALRVSDDEEIESGNVNLKIIILVLSIICMIGCVFGYYLLQRKRRKETAERI